MLATCLAVILAAATPPPPAGNDVPSAGGDAAALAEAVAGLTPAEPDDPTWRARAEGVRALARRYSAAHPDDPRGIETAATLSMALSDDAGVDADMGLVMAHSPEKTGGGLKWVDYWMDRDTTHATWVLEQLLEGRPDALIYIDRLCRLLAVEAPQRLHARFDRWMSPDADVDQAALELDVLARAVPAQGVAVGRRLLAAHPGHVGLTAGTARAYRTGNRFAEARALLNSLPPGAITDPAHVYLWSDVHYADNDFTRARELMESIDMEALSASERAGLHRRLKFMLPLRRAADDAWPTEQRRRFEDAAAGTNPLVRMVINDREVTAELFENDAPNTVASFVAAADLQMFDGWAAGQVHTGFRTIMGDRHEDDGYPAWTIASEHTLDTARPIVSGSLVAYKTSRPRSTDTTFFVMHFPGPHLNNERTCFGRVVSGLDVIREMNEGDVVDSIEIIRRGDRAYDPMVFDADGTERLLSDLLSEQP